ncbi:MAG: cation diffusion facilitator family transporter [Bacteroidales bacterium]|nr:cation diffusion facilitator family transporter [Bacteroidales bacterium]
MKKSRKYYSNLEGWTSFTGNIVLGALKYWAGIVSGSVALIADAWHTLSDSIGSVIVIIGSYVSAKPADKKHPFGHGRAELISTLIISVLLFIIAWSFMKEAIEKLINHEETHYGTLAILITIFSIVGKEIMAQFAFFCARKADSETLRADAWHHRTDSLSSIIILLGIIVGGKIWWMDSLLGIIVAIMIGWTAMRFALTSVSKILGEEPDQNLITRIEAISEEIAGERANTHHFHLHDYETHKELTFHLRLNSEMNIGEAHDLVTQIETRIKNELNTEATIHIEPNNRTDQ